MFSWSVAGMFVLTAEREDCGQITTAQIVVFQTAVADRMKSCLTSNLGAQTIPRHCKLRTRITGLQTSEFEEPRRL